MKHMIRLVSGWMVWGALSLGATQSVYHNQNPLVAPPQIAPQVDATTFINSSVFDVSTRYPFPFENCLFFENRGPGIMQGHPGYRFQFNTNFFSYAADTFENRGLISVTTNLYVYATNIISSGDLQVGPGGIIQLFATNLLQLEATSLRSGSLPNTLFNGGIYIGGSFINDPGVHDVYWGGGFNNTMDDTDDTMFLISTTNSFSIPNFGVPYAGSPVHEVQEDSYPAAATYSTYVPYNLFGFGFNNVAGGVNLYDVQVYTNILSSTNYSIQMVFIPTNSLDTNFSASARFIPFFGDLAPVVVQFAAWDFDIALQQFTTNYVYIIDETPLATNVTMQSNILEPGQKRPSTIAITRGEPIDWQFFGITNNAVFTNTMVYNTNYADTEVNLMYAAYSAQIGEATTETGFGFLNFLFTPPTTLEPTNMPGRIEIQGETVNLSDARIRAESLLSIKTENLVSNSVASIDAPFLIFDVTSRESVLEITNLAPPTVRRMAGQVSLWSGVWTNTLQEVVPGVTNMLGTNATTTNIIEIAFSALVVENQLTTEQPTVLHEFAARATNLVIGDNLVMGRSFEIEATNLHVIGALMLPANYDWGATNVRGLVNLTNDGLIDIPGGGYFGVEPAEPYANFVNRGYIQGSSHQIRADYFENRASPNLADSGLVSAEFGEFSLEANTAYITNGVLTGSGNINISANRFLGVSTHIHAGASNYPGALAVSVTNRLSDGGINANNLWVCSSGFNFGHKAETGDLMGTILESQVPRVFGRAYHWWAGENRGPNVSGYQDNMALGHLRLVGTNGGIFELNGAGSDNGLYVDYLELVNSATNYLTNLRINPGLTIYFANANLPPEKLDGTHDGRLVWMRDYSGPKSSTNIVYPSGLVQGPFNISLTLSKDIDSDGDGVANASDPTPFLVDEADLRISLRDFPAPTAVLSWNSVSKTSNKLEYATNLMSPTWQTLTNFVNGSFTVPVEVSDPLPVDRMRFYRVTMESQ